MQTYTTIKALAKERNMDMRTFIAELGLAESTVYGWKNGNLPALPVIIKIADYFDVSVDYLLNRTNHREVIRDNKSPSMSTLDLIHKIESSNYSDTQAKLIMKLIDCAENFDKEKIDEPSI